MEIFITTSIKSFDLNPTHPGPLPRVSFHTSATQQIERSESKAARGRARSATDEVYVRSSPNGLAMISSSRLAELQHAPPAWKFAPRKATSVSTAKMLRERIKRNDDERLPRFLDCRKWKTTARP